MNSRIRISILAMILISLLILSLVSFIIPNKAYSDCKQCDIQIKGQEDLSSDVKTFIADTYLAHIEEHPDPNESVEVLKLYLEGQVLLHHNKIDEATTLFNRTIKEFPECRHAHAGLANALWQKYEKTKDIEDLQAAVHKYLQAAEIGMKFGTVRYTYRIAMGLAQLEDKFSMDKFFTQVLEINDRRYLTCIDYARGLSLLNDPKAEDLFKKAIELRPEENVDARAYYAEWLLDHNCEEDVLTIIDSDEHIEYMHFLRGVALERLGRLDEALKAYEIFIPYSQFDPAPEKYQNKESKIQKDIIFEGSIAPMYIPCDGYDDLALCIECEAGGESEGGKRAVGWTVRTRVFKGTLPNCVYVDNSGSTLSCKYSNVIYQPYQFYTGCGRTPSVESKHVRYDVWYGKSPDPTTGYCPIGSYSGNACSGSVHCSGSSSSGASSKGPMRFYSTSGSCPTGGAYSCLNYKGKICSNGGYDHCFYNRP